MAGANLTFENAPRDVDKLMSFGRYSLRNLAYEIGRVSKDDPSGVTAFDKLKLKERAQEVLASLEQMDKKIAAEGNGKKPAAKATKRQPVKPKDAPKAAAKASPPTNGPAPDQTVLVEKIDQLVDAITEMATANSRALSAIEAQLATIVQISKANMYMNGIVGEQILQGDIGEMVSDGFQGAETIEIPEPTEGN